MKRWMTLLTVGMLGACSVGVLPMKSSEFQKTGRI